eukprot:scaffold1883_cov396-Prasinococcus_capsulatus_cf.AAC.4
MAASSSRSSRSRKAPFAAAASCRAGFATLRGRQRPRALEECRWRGSRLSEAENWDAGPRLQDVDHMRS